MPFYANPRWGSLFAFFGGVTLGFFIPLYSSAQVQTEMRLFTDSFMSPDFEATQKTNYQFIGAQIKTDAFTEDAVKMDVAGGVAVGAPLLNYLNITELYIQNRQNETETFYVGRKRMLWSELDARWDLGVWEPLFKWNPLAPEHQGLSGVFWQTDKPRYSLMLFASPFYLPDQGPSFEIENGSFVKGNPWFRRPPESIRIWREATAIDYQFEKPNESQVVLQNSFGMRVSVGDANGWRTQLSYTYKPANQLALGYEGNLDVSKLKGAIDLQPQVFYHSLLGMDVVHKNGRVRMGISGLLDRPNKEMNFDAKWTHPVFQDALLVTPFIEWSDGKWGGSLQHLDIFGGQVEERGDLADPRRPALMVRYPFQQAQQLSLMTHLTFAKDLRVVGRLSWTHSQKNEFDLIRLSARIQFSRLWSMVSEMQLVKAYPVTAGTQNEISQFVNNDRFMLGAAYVF